MISNPSDREDWSIGPAPAYGIAQVVKNPVLICSLLATAISGGAFLQKYLSLHDLEATLSLSLPLGGCSVLFSLWAARSVSYWASPARKSLFMESGLSGFQSRIRHTILLNQVKECDTVASPFEQLLQTSSLLIKLSHGEVVRFRFVANAATICDWINRNGSGEKARPIETF